DGMPKGRVEPSRPAWVNRAQGAVNRVTKLMDPDALMVITVERQTQYIFLAETGRFAARAADPFILIGRVGRMAVIGHIGIELIFADDNQVHPITYHRLNNVRPPCEHVGYDF